MSCHDLRADLCIYHEQTKFQQIAQVAVLAHEGAARKQARSSLEVPACGGTSIG